MTTLCCQQGDMGASRRGVRGAGGRSPAEMSRCLGGKPVVECGSREFERPVLAAAGPRQPSRHRTDRTSYRRAVRARGHFPTEMAALKCLYLVTGHWTPPGAARHDGPPGGSRPSTRSRSGSKAGSHRPVTNQCRDPDPPLIGQSPSRQGSSQRPCTATHRPPCQPDAYARPDRTRRAQHSDGRLCTEHSDGRLCTEPGGGRFRSRCERTGRASRQIGQAGRAGHLGLLGGRGVIQHVPAPTCAG